MAELSPLALWRRFLALPNDSRIKTLGVAFLVALISALGVSVTSVLLEPRQQAHLDAAREARLSEMIAALPGLGDLLRDAKAETLDAVLVDLARGTISAETDPHGYDFLSAQTDPARTVALSPEQDIAGIGRRPILAPAYLLRGADGLALVVLPVYGTGYQSTIRAYLALSADLTTIAGLRIYEQGETPGLGTRITDPGLAGALVRQTGRGRLGGHRHRRAARRGHGLREIDAISGATRSSMGVARLVQFWLGPDGFGPFLAALRAGEER